MNGNWLKLFRKLKDHPVWKDPARGYAFIDFLLHTRWKDGFEDHLGISVPVKRGQLLMSQNTMAKRWKCDRKKVLRILRQLGQHEMLSYQIVTKTAPDKPQGTAPANNTIGLLISITNFDKFQADFDDEALVTAPVPAPAGHQRGTSGAPLKKKEKKEKKEKKWEEEAATSVFPDWYQAQLGRLCVLPWVTTKIKEGFSAALKNHMLDPAAGGDNGFVKRAVDYYVVEFRDAPPPGGVTPEGKLSFKISDFRSGRFDAKHSPSSLPGGFNLAECSQVGPNNPDYYVKGHGRSY